jgi:uncharacterized membrane protein HdeD (DUF308 family)
MKKSTRYLAYFVVLSFGIFAGLYKNYGYRDIWPMILIFIIIFAVTEIITYYKTRNK